MMKAMQAQRLLRDLPSAGVQNVMLLDRHGDHAVVYLRPDRPAEALPVVLATAVHSVRGIGGVKGGDKVLVHAGASGLESDRGSDQAVIRDLPNGSPACGQLTVPG